MSGSFEARLNELKSLPELEPAAELEPAVLAAMARAAAARKSARPAHTFARAAAWIVAIGVGTGLALWAMRFESEPQPAQAQAAADDAYYDLAEQSAQLEEVLALLPPPRRVMRVGTASTIVGLEDRIALIDAELHRSDTASAPPEYRAALMRDRVEVMNALVNVRYAQSQAFIY
jgi:hypothetical protein